MISIHHSQGIYLHIPFCKKACTYCNYHFSTSRRGQEELVVAMGKELDLRRSEIASAPIATIYFGGGTPSILSQEQIDYLLGKIFEHGRVIPEVEITLEANPDDLTPSAIERLVNSRINRLSIGVQSFLDDDLSYMGRAHNGQQAIQALQDVSAAGMENFSIDLIFGSPTTSHDAWTKNLQLALESQAKHISAYALTIEPKTTLAHQIEKGNSPMPSEERAAEQYFRMCDFFVGAGFEHYEISSFAQPGFRSRHNSNYWSGRPYMGIGPSAHGFDGQLERRWNIASNLQYVRAISELKKYTDYLDSKNLYESEKLRPSDRYNESIMTGLRETAGIDISVIASRFGEHFSTYFLHQMSDHLETGRLRYTNGRYSLAPSARFLADGIAADGFWLD
ncbi:MAG: radical SAM family heme chaperone HemW [Bacteroidota bacterium]